MSNTDERFEALVEKVRRQQSKKSASFKDRGPSSTKWRIVMLQALQKLGTDSKHDAAFLGYLASLIKKLSEDIFIEAIMNLKPLKPHFASMSHGKNFSSSITDSPVLKEQNFSQKPKHQQTSTDDTIDPSEEKAAAKLLAEQEQILNILIENGYMASQMSSPKHPFSAILECIVILLENKYKNWIEKKFDREGTLLMERLCQKLARDLRMFETFFKMASTPIIDYLSFTKLKTSKIQQIIEKFVVDFFRNYGKICQILKKILKFGASKSRQIELFMTHCPHQAVIDQFDIPETLKIEGCYVLTINSIIQFSNAETGKETLDKLCSIRASFYKDIEEYKKANKVECEKVTGQSQLQIFKYLLTKLGVFSIDIYSQLKFLEVIYGEEQISFHFDEASYIHSQLSVAMETIRSNL